LIKDYDLSAYDADVLTASRELADYFEACVNLIQAPKLVCNWVTGPLLGLLNAQGKSIENSPVSSENLAGLLQIISDGTISNKIAKTVFDEMAHTGKTPKEIVEAKGLVQVSDVSAIDAVVNDVLAKNPKEVEAYQNGKTKLMGFFVGQVMRQTQGKANPKIVNEVLRDKLKS
jgi:aspartyl-tRNA(Asn)/glutamyl-tRNA(Gln) amidotransferase subunit B